MYHIKDDKRCKASVSLIYQALILLLEEKPFSEITITDIQNKSTVGRSTFYRNFDQISDVLAQKCDAEFENLFFSYISSSKTNKHSLDDRFAFMRYFFEYWKERSQIIEILIKIERIGILYQSLIEKSVILTYEMLPSVDTTSDDYKYFISMRAGLIIGFLITWIKEGKTRSAEDLLKILIENFNIITSSPLLL